MKTEKDIPAKSPNEDMYIPFDLYEYLKNNNRGEKI